MGVWAALFQLHDTINNITRCKNADVKMSLLTYINASNMSNSDSIIKCDTSANVHSSLWKE